MDRIVNIINFIRGCEPRVANDSFLAETTKKQILLVNEYGFPATWLMQYDAMQNENLIKFMKSNLDSSHEVGIWLEIVQGLVEKAGLKWRGRFPWDWYPNVGFSVGYTPLERELLVDVVMEEFKSIWGEYPKSVGSWFIDAHTLGYMSDRYGIKASCNCREQCGTDGYTLWGGYWSGAYFPSRKNALLPAQTESGQISVPVFRMLGADPIYQYASEVKPQKYYEGYSDQFCRTQDIITLETVSHHHQDCGGSNPDWIKWFFRNNFAKPYLAVAYAQVGQENSMGWDNIKTGFCLQLSRLKALHEECFLTVETLAKSGEKFSNEFSVSPATAICALEDWKNEDRAAVWYMNRFQRLGFLVDEGHLYLRDWQVYDENYPEPFLETKCTETSCKYEALPVMDGFNWRSSLKFKEQLGSLYAPIKVLPSIGFKLRGGKGRIEKVTAVDGGTLEICWRSEGGLIRIVCSEDVLCIYSNSKEYLLQMVFDDADAAGTQIEITNDSVRYNHSGIRYGLQLEVGRIEADTRKIYPKNGVLRFGLFSLVNRPGVSQSISVSTRS